MAAKKKTKAPEPSLVDGRLPAPLPMAEGPLADFIARLHATEQGFATDSPHAMRALTSELSQIRAGQRPWSPSAVSAWAESLGLDLGEYPDNPDRSRLTTKPQWKKQDAQFHALTMGAFNRSMAWKLILAVVSLEPSLQLPWVERLEKVNAWHRDQLQQVVIWAPALSAEIVALLRQWVRGEGPRVTFAATAFFQQPAAMAFEELAGLILETSLEVTAPLQRAKALLDGADWTRADPRWRPLLERFVPLAAVTYDFATADLFRAQQQLAALATKALQALPD